LCNFAQAHSVRTDPLAENRYDRSVVSREDVRAFLDRRWDLVRESKDRHNAQRPAAELIEAADELRMHAREVGARPSDADRARDLATLVSLKSKLERANKNRSRLR
jgi:hypothetical protein